MKTALPLFLLALLTLVLASCGGIFDTRLVFSVRYDSNGATSGTVPVDGHRYHEGDTVTLPYNSGHLAKTGCTFIGWSYWKSGEQGSALPGEQFRIGEAMMVNLDPEIVEYAIFIPE